MQSKAYPDYTKFFQKPSSSPKDTLEFIWLGQAGFAFRYNNISLIIDPYLSDFLSKKYKDGIFPHKRLMDIPILPEKIQNLDILLSTHPHSDHMDPETLPGISKANPNVKIIVPGPAVKEAIKRGAPSENIISAFSEQTIRISEDIEIIPIPAAHEQLKTDGGGNHFFLGYIFKFRDFTVYHSGDCIPYPGLIDLLVKYEVKYAFLPINGRDEYRRKNNIAGNFHSSEVIEICLEARIKQLIVHHFGMFAYNTVSLEQLEYVSNQSNSKLQITIPKVFHKYSFKTE